MQNKDKILAKLNALCNNTLMSHLGIEYTDLGADFLVAEMNINSSHHQPMGILHGGTSLALAESVGSALSFINVNMSECIVKGLEINANHVASISEGKLIARASFIHKGKHTHVVGIEIKSEQGKLITISRLTNVIISK